MRGNLVGRARLGVGLRDRADRRRFIFGQGHVDATLWVATLVLLSCQGRGSQGHQSDNSLHVD